MNVNENESVNASVNANDHTCEEILRKTALKLCTRKQRYRQLSKCMKVKM